MYLHTVAHSTQRSKSAHTSPLTDGGDDDSDNGPLTDGGDDDSDNDDNKLKLTRRSSDTTSTTLLLSDDEDEIVKVVKRDFQVCLYVRMYVCSYT